MTSVLFSASSGITHSTVVTCLGNGRATHVNAMRDGTSGLSQPQGIDLPFDCYVGQVADLDALAIPSRVAEYDNRATRLAMAALISDGFEKAALKVRTKWGSDRCGIVLGTSSSGMDRLEQVYRSLPDHHAMPERYSPRHHDSQQAVSAFLQDYLGFSGPSYTVSTACSSSAKALIDAYQLIETGVCDAVLTGGVDTVCLTSLNGFESLELVSRSPCRPCDRARDGLSIGEASALMIVQRDASGCIRLSGYGESSDGTNMSTPPKDGAGAATAIQQALKNANLSPEDVDYVNLHGTATVVNDAAEANAVRNAVYENVPASSMKGAIGHTLGAAGAAEAVMCLFAIEEEIIPPNTGLVELDPQVLPNVSPKSRPGKLKNVLSNSFGFGGSNCALVLSR